MGTSTYADGPMGSGQQPTAENIARREVWVAAQGMSTKPVMLRAEHGKVVTMVDERQAGMLVQGDGLVTRTKGLPLVMTHSDCLPVFLLDAEETICGMVHAGWRGVVAEIVPEALRVMRDQGAKEVRVHIGPHIRSCCFEIQEDVAAPLRSIAGDAVIVRDGKMYGDLAAAVVAQVGGAYVTADERCTSCNKVDGQPLFASYRRDRQIVKNMISCIALS